MSRSRSLPLYIPKTSDAPFVPADSGCTGCLYHEDAPSVCLTAQGEPGGLLVIHETPFAGDAEGGMLFSSKMGGWLRAKIAEHWTGSVAFDVAIRCSGSIELLTPGYTPKQRKDKRSRAGKAVKACGKFIHEQIRRMRPSRIICLGPLAAQIVLGRGVDYYSTRGHVAWYSGGNGTWAAADVPTFAFPRLSDLSNRIIRSWFEADLERALTVPVDKLRHPPLFGTARLVESGADARAAVADIKRHAFGYIDTETSGVMFSDFFRVLCVAVAPSHEDYAYVWTETGLADPEAFRVLQAYLADETHRKGGQNIKYDRKALRAADLVMRGIDRDCRLERKILDADASADLDTMAEIVGMGGHKKEAQAYVTTAAKVITDARSKVERGKLRVDEITDPIILHAVMHGDIEPKSYAYAYIPKDVLYRYCALDAIASARLDELFTAQLAEEAPEAGEHYDRLVRPASNAVAQIEEWGVLVSSEGLSEAKHYCEMELRRINAVLEQAAPGINLDSTQQVAKLLYDDLKLPCKVFTDEGGRSTDKEALTAIQALHPIVSTIIEHRDIAKIYGTYVLGLAQRQGKDGRIHCTFLLDGARSGRMSGTNPNLQNIPRKTTFVGKMVKDLFVAKSGWSLVQFDYSQLELRVAALMSGDPLMAEIYTSIDPKTGKPIDYHRRTAELIAPVAWGLDPSKVGEVERNMAKIVNFGLLYGMTDNGLAERLTNAAREDAIKKGLPEPPPVTREQAAKIRKAIFGQFVRLAAWIEECVDTAKREGYCYTSWRGKRARRRPLIHLMDAPQKDGRPTFESITAKNSSYNTPVQGTASDFMLASIVEIVEWILTNDIPAHLVLTVHDSVILEVRDDFIHVVINKVKSIMEAQGWGTVPIVVDVEVGKSWGSLEKFSAWLKRQAESTVPASQYVTGAP